MLCVPSGNKRLYTLVVLIPNWTLVLNPIQQLYIKHEIPSGWVRLAHHTQCVQIACQWQAVFCFVLFFQSFEDRNSILWNKFWNKLVLKAEQFKLILTSFPIIWVCWFPDKIKLLHYKIYVIHTPSLYLHKVLLCLQLQTNTSKSKISSSINKYSHKPKSLLWKGSTGSRNKQYRSCVITLKYYTLISRSWKR